MPWMTSSLKFLLTRFTLLAVVCVGLITGCASGSRSIDIPFDPYSPTTRASADIAAQRAELQKLLEDYAGDDALLADVRAMLDGMYYDNQGDYAAATKAWFTALPHAEGPFGEKAVSGWVKSYCKNLGKKIDRNVLAKLLLAETQGGNISPWMVEKDLGSETKLLVYLVQWVPDALEGDPAREGKALDAPERSGIPAGDPLMTKLAGEVCRFSSRYGAGWKEWRSSLNKDVNEYFDALIMQCSGNAWKASEKFLGVAPKLSGSNSTAHLALESYARVIKIRRDAGERDTVAPFFLPLMRLWKNPSITEASLGLSRQAFDLRRIDDSLSAARHRALINDTENAKLFVQDTLNFVSSAFTQPWAMTPELKSQLAGTTAEAYHLLGLRLAVEARDWDRASAVTTLALQTQSLPDDWKQRLQWSLGLYDYLAGNIDGARRKWEQLLSDNSDDSFRPMLLFWVSQCHMKLGNASESEFYQKTLVQDHPLSFYAVTALSQVGGNLRDRWRERFKDLPALRSSLKHWADEDLTGYRADPRKARLLRRAELLVAAHTDVFVNTALDEVQKTLDLQATGEKEVGWAIYVSRLYAASGNYLSAIAMTTKISKVPQFWDKRPEQLLVFFPRPYSDIFQRVGVETGSQAETLMGISRQESGFRADIRSGANAYGVMQLTPPTARRMVKETGLDVGAIPEALTRPEANIRLGASYYKWLIAHYRGSKSSAFASYNAGEQTVDAWQERRNFDDPLIFIELIPYTETRTYVKNVWRNESVYGYFSNNSEK